MFIDFRERGMIRKRERERDRCERNIDWLPPTCTPMGDQTCKPFCIGWHSNKLRNPARVGVDIIKKYETEIIRSSCTHSQILPPFFIPSLNVNHLWRLLLLTISVLPHCNDCVINQQFVSMPDSPLTDEHLKTEDVTYLLSELSIMQKVDAELILAQNSKATTKISSLTKSA